MLKFLTLIFLFSIFTTLISASSSCSALDEIPECAIPCLKRAAKTIGCSTEDYSCVCNKATSAGTDSLFLNAAKPCVLTKCGISQASKAQGIMQRVCRECVWSGGKDEL